MRVDETPPPITTLRVFWAWLPASLYMLLIWWLSSNSGFRVPLAHIPFGDRGLHFMEFAVLAVLVGHAVHAAWRLQGPRAWLLAWWTSSVWGMLDELHQCFVPGRVGDLVDLQADALGALAGVLLHAVMRQVWELWRSRGG